MRITRVTRPTYEEADSTWQATQVKITQALKEFEETHGITDTFIGEEVNEDQTQKTIIRAWPSLEIAELWVAAMTEIGVTSAEVEPE